MPCCVAIGCSNSDKKRYLMKHFPRDPIRKKLWMAKMKRDKWTPSQHSCICEVHFEENMWEKTREDGSRRLKCNAFPTLFSFTKIIKQRKPPLERSNVSHPYHIHMIQLEKFTLFQIQYIFLKI
ncbi:unnamed protein product [Macrosiphum euphorbiae]|uniref:THAP-type domain-containing protein n=1 Tax=Macrosiphum euphorbiae TaxID=13131 RepID=A0AAV0WKX7_9HEMI|nr:unnamed protein product [Macrosiphum euphorbiae]